MDNYYSFNKEKQAHISNYRKTRSKEQLAKDTKKKFMTTMIGAIARFEESFGYLWGHGEERLTAEQRRNKTLWDHVRKTILDNGNDQIQFFNEDLENYEVLGSKFSIQLPVRKDRRYD